MFSRISDVSFFREPSFFQKVFFIVIIKWGQSNSVSNKNTQIIFVVPKHQILKFGPLKIAILFFHRNHKIRLIEAEIVSGCKFL